MTLFDLRITCIVCHSIHYYVTIIYEIQGIFVLFLD